VDAEPFEGGGDAAAGAGPVLAAGAQPVPDIGGHRRGTSARRARVRRAKEETRSSSRSPARSRIPAVRGTLRSRQCRTGESPDQAIMSPGVIGCGWHRPAAGSTTWKQPLQTVGCTLLAGHPGVPDMSSVNA
jgi:hypothetical protein